jgi:hypothetical protein
MIKTLESPMNQKFVTYLKLLESRAPASKKADFHRAIELYTAGAAKMESNGNPFERSTGNLGRTQEPFSASNRKPGEGIANAKRSPEVVKADADRAAAIRKAEEGFPAAADTVIKAAETQPGKIDAWVDYRLEPAIKRARKADGLGGSEGSKAKYKSDYNAAKKKYKEEDKEAREKARKDEEESLARSREEIEYKKQQEDRKADEKRMSDSEKKREDLGSNRDYKFSAEQKLNSTDKDINRHVATARSEDMAKGEEADKKMNAADKFWEENGDKAEFGTPMSDEEIAADQAEKRAEQKHKNDEADNAMAAAEKWWSDNGDNYGLADVAAVNIKGLRAAFESVYGDSSEFTDAEIRTICESCYRRSRKK